MHCEEHATGRLDRSGREAIDRVRLDCQLDSFALSGSAQCRDRLEHIPLESTRFERNMLQLLNLERFLVDRVTPPGGQAL
jgi:hypothetical protein